MRFFTKANYPFLEWRKRAYALTALLLLLGVGAMVLNSAQGRRWLNYGIDFLGGTEVQLSFTHPTSVEKIRAAAAQGGANDWEIVQFGKSNDYMARMRSFGQETGSDATVKVQQVLGHTFKYKTDYTVARVEAVGPKAGADLQRNALIAILLSFVTTALYLAMRFEWRFGVAAVIATAHDILITLGFLALTRTEINLGTVAAVLTIVGYSLHDTIVVFDRIREDLGKPRAGRSFIQILDKAINETLPRTVLTASTVLATLLALLLFGGPVIRDFAMVLFLGITIGTFSSIFVASPALYEIERRWPREDSKSPVRSKPASRRVESAV
ncbi:MAG TPA: protein translocase subunit SecF [Longimicrobiaceae bacterium]|jgi:preprotein translocase subunit SecF|nr:protein translocase subunit SecF [Longimicrobiaceae bacterium]